MSKFRVVGTIAFVLCLGAANASATAQGRSEGAPGWGGGGQPGTQFETPKGPDELTKPHTTGPQNGSNPPQWGARGDPDTPFETPAPGSGTKSHTPGRP
jgi:hypothetical protein